MSDTPRTDAYIGEQDGTYMTEGEIAMCNFARQLERELAGLHADNAELIDRLREARESHLHASARDVQTIQRQSVEIAKWQAMASNMEDSLLAIKEAIELVFWSTFDGNEQVAATAETLRNDVSQTMGDAFEKVTNALAAYESAKKGELPDPLAEAVKRMKAVPIEVLYTDYLHHESPKCYDCMEAVRARLIQAAKKPAASLDEPPGPA